MAGTDRLLDGHPANTVTLCVPIGVAVDTNGSLSIADAADYRIRKVDASGIISTYATTGAAGYNGDRIKAANAELNSPESIAVDGGNLFVADADNFTIRMISPDSITFGGVKMAATDILYVGVTENAGLYQVNLRVPESVPDGDQSLVITVGGAESPAGGFITVKAPNRERESP